MCLTVELGTLQSQAGLFVSEHCFESDERLFFGS